MPSAASLRIIFFQNTFLFFRVSHFLACDVCSPPSSAARRIPVMSRLSSGVPHTSFSAAAPHPHPSPPPPLSALLCFSDSSNSPHSNLSCSSSFYTLQPLICIFLSSASPLSSSILFTVFSPQLLGSPSPLYLPLLPFFPPVASSSLGETSRPCRNISQLPAEHL